MIALCFVYASAGAFGAASESEADALEFKTEAGKQAFEDAKKAFGEKKLVDCKKLLLKAKKEAKNSAAKKEIIRWTLGLKGLGECLRLEKLEKSRGGWVYENAQRKFHSYAARKDPSAPLFAALLERLELPQRKLVHKVETFDRFGPYNAKYGKTFVTREKHPAYVVRGEKALRWECKNRNCQVLKILSVPRDWSQYAYLGFWVCQEKGKTSGLQVSVTNQIPKSRRKSLQRSFNGFQGKIPGKSGWTFVTLGLGSGKGLRRVGKGDLASVGFIHFQLPTVRRFVSYWDDIVLVRKN